MANRTSSTERGRGGARTAGSNGYKPRRDWSKVVLITISVIIVLSMVLSLFAGVIGVL